MYLKNTKTGEVFCYNERLAARPGYVKVAKLESDKKEPVSLVAAADTPEGAAAYAQAAAAKKSGPRTSKK